MNSAALKQAEVGLHMRITVNGEDIDNLPAGISVAQLLERLKLPVTKIAVERNLEIVPKSTFVTATLAPNDKLEIIHFIGGG